MRKALRDLEGRAAAGELDLLTTTTADEDQTDETEAHETAEADTLGATVTENLADLIMERDRVIELRNMAQAVLDSGHEAKFARLLEAMKDPQFAQEKMLVFTEHRDTANYLTDKLEALGSPAASRNCTARWTTSSGTGRWSSSGARMRPAARST